MSEKTSNPQILEKTVRELLLKINNAKLVNSAKHAQLQEIYNKIEKIEKGESGSGVLNAYESINHGIDLSYALVNAINGVVNDGLFHAAFNVYDSDSPTNRTIFFGDSIDTTNDIRYDSQKLSVEEVHLGIDDDVAELTCVISPDSFIYYQRLGESTESRTTASEICFRIPVPTGFSAVKQETAAQGETYLITGLQLFSQDPDEKIFCTKGGANFYILGKVSGHAGHHILEPCFLRVFGKRYGEDAPDPAAVFEGVSPERPCFASVIRAYEQ